MNMARISACAKLKKDYNDGTEMIKIKLMVTIMIMMMMMMMIMVMMESDEDDQGSKLATNWSHMRLDFWLCA